MDDAVKSPRAMLAGLEASVLPEAVRVSSEQEIAFGVRILEKALAEEELETIVRVQVAADFESAVEELLRDRGERRPARYVAMRERSLAVAMTFYTWHERDLEVSIVLSKQLWDWQGNAAPFYRWYVIMHELGHVFLEAREQRTRSPEADPGTFARQMSILAQDVLDEVRADRFADWSFRTFGIVRDGDGRVLGIVDSPVGGADFAESARGILDGLCVWVHERVNRYRLTTEGLDEIPGELIGKLRELFIVLAHLLGAFGGTERQAECRELLAASPGFRAYLEADWERLEAAVCSDTLGWEAVAAEIQATILNLSQRLGIRIEDTPQGWFVHVGEPILCGEKV